MGRTWAQAADVPLDEADAEADDEEEGDDEALALVSEPDFADEAESDGFEDDDAGVLLDDEPRLSFR